MKEYLNFRITRCDNILTVALDVPTRPLNVLTFDVMSELEQIISDCEHDPQLRAIVFTSDKESGFLAGADVAAIASIQSPGEAVTLLRRGQELFDRIEGLPITTITVIHGPCLGGGLELSLACDYRIARDNSSTKMGLPEIKLGLIPGWGGTQRLPQLVGIRQALGMILTGKHLDTASAIRCGLVDRAISADQWDEGLDKAIGELVHRPRKFKRGWKRWAEDSLIGRCIIARMTRQTIRSKTRHYPALAAALRAILAGFSSHRDGLAVERDEFAGLLATPTCRRLLELFFAREKARSASTWSTLPRAAHRHPIQKVGVVGAGAMGAGIGQLAAVRGYQVAIKEMDAAAADTGRSRVEKLVSDFARRKHLSDAKTSNLLGNVTVGYQDEMLDDCDLVVEAVVERADVKATVFETLDRRTGPTAILASNTSALSVTQMARATQRPSRVAGLHFFNPVHRMELVEVVRAAETDEVTLARLVGFVKALGKTPVVTSDSPGFLVNRVLFPYLGEAILMVAAGYDPAEIDRALRKFGMPMGPLELIDQVGVDVALHVSGALDGVLKGAEPIADQLQQMVSSGLLGRKSGKGFYHYRDGKTRPHDELRRIDLPMESQAWVRDGLSDGLNPITRRLVYPLLAESVRCLEERVVDEAWTVDLAMVLGTGFAPHRGGPLHVLDSIGLFTAVKNFQRLQVHLGTRFEPPAMLIDMAGRGDLFFESNTIDRQPSTRQEVTSRPAFES